MVRQAQEKIVLQVSKWSGVVTAPHPFGGTEFKVGRREIGHVHGDYQADIAFPISVRNRLIAENKAEPHHILPSSGSHSGLGKTATLNMRSNYSNTPMILQGPKWKNLQALKFRCLIE
jgi:hypothetical protein